MKIDWKTDLKQLYAPSAKAPDIVTVPRFNFLMIDGAGNPNTAQAYRDALTALYGVAYTLKFMLKKLPDGPDVAVRPLEGLWWADDMERFSAERKDDWLWKAMIAQPDVVTPDHVRQAVDEVRRKKAPVALDLMRFDAWEEGLSAQVLHIGPYAAEAPTIERLHAFIEENGYRRAGKHHEIYLSDPSRAAPDKLKTIVRQPITR